MKTGYILVSKQEQNEAWILDALGMLSYNLDTWKGDANRSSSFN